jgi:hypothetical protein
MRVGSARVVLTEVKINAEEDVVGGDQVYIYAIIHGPGGRSVKQSEVKQGSKGETLTFNFRAFDQLIRDGDVFIIDVYVYEKDVDFDDLVVKLSFSVHCPPPGQVVSERSSHTGDTIFGSYTASYEVEARCAEIPDELGLELKLPERPLPAGLRDRKAALLAALAPERIAGLPIGCVQREPAVTFRIPRRGHNH